MQLPPQTNSVDQIALERSLIQSLTGFPDSDIILDDFGWDSRAYIIENGKIVFKFPRSKSIKKIYPVEIAALKVAEGLSTDILIPKVKWTSQDNSYFGYEGIIGSSALDKLDTMNNRDKLRLGASIGEFLKIFHRQVLAIAPKIEIEDEIANLHEKYNAGRQILVNYFSTQAMRKLDKFIEKELPSQLHELGINTSLSHGDLGLWNMIYTTDGHLGFIDFEEASYCDESKDFIALKDPLLLDAALQAYGNDSSHLRLKIEARSKIMSFADIVFFEGKNNASGIETTVESIKSFIK